MIQLGEEAKKIALKKVKELRRLDVSTGIAIGKDTIKAQLKAADKINALFSVIIGQREAVTNSAIIRDMRDGIQETVELEDLNSRLITMVDERIKEEEEYTRKLKKKQGGRHGKKITTKGIKQRTKSSKSTEKKTKAKKIYK